MYGYKHRNMTRGHKCDYKKQVHEEMLDVSVAEVISKLVSNPKFSDLICNKINMEVDTSALDQEIVDEDILDNPYLLYETEYDDYIEEKNEEPEEDLEWRPRL